MASYQKYKTKKGERWMFQMYVENPATGKSERITKRGFLKRSDAKLAADNLADDLKVGKNVLVKVLFKDVANELLDQQEKICKPSTMHSKRSKFNSRIIPFFGEQQIDRITPEYCQRFIDELESEIGSARDYGIQANLVFKLALRKRLIVFNPFDLVVYSQTKNEAGDGDTEEYEGYWTKDEITEFLGLAENHTSYSNYVLFRLALYTGARKGELLALQETDLLADTQEIHIRHTLYWDKSQKHHMLLTPKTKRSIRKIKIDDLTWSMLQRLILSNKAARLAVGKQNSPEKFLFVRDGFRPQRTAYPNEVLQAMCKRFNLKYIKFHGLRHTHASMLFASGANMKEVQERLGHSRIETTMNIYTHITDETKNDVQSKFMDFMTAIDAKKENESLVASKQHQNGEIL